MTWDHYFKTATLINGVYAIAIFTIGIFLAKVIKQRLERLFELHAKENTVKLFAVKAGYAMTIVAIAISALSRLGIPTASLITLLGAASLTIGLAMKDFLSHVAAGLLLIALKPFRIGDSVNIEGISGVIESINLFTTCIRTDENEKWHINNSKIMNDKIGVKNITEQ